ncbi:MULTISPECIES: SDR family oxidoreductase [Paenibacillus]|uniref:Short-chain dehydrogenase/reductase n=1 Tax=Paenibacillus campinasensis TaxID=66347 RepID=A0A268EWC0_9BACL|nr:MULTISPECIES: SDR family oxidoreductase [Paenibacillus]PAD77374.1 short-chain dehydrogenase/reductase [Paenibacillus campinasensis]PAK50284.1 short-chain dehydrogenase/reductase [Paenibacillus sp. 7541]
MTKTVLITGSSTGLGYTAAQKFAREGWNVIATMRKPDQRLAEIYPERIAVYELDVTKPATIKAAIQAGVERFGRIDAVVNNAGVSVLSIFEATPMEVVRSVYDTNVFGVMNVIQAITPYFREQGGGTIVNVTSNVGFTSNPLLSIYVSTKHAVEGLTESLSYELESQNIKIKLVEPGAMRTTNFAANTMAATEGVSVPPAYKPYYDYMMNTMMNYPFDNADENQVADQVYAAACDPSIRLRYLAGPDAEETARLRWTRSEEEYMATMRDLLGQTAWRNSRPDVEQ